MDRIARVLERLGMLGFQGAGMLGPPAKDRRIADLNMGEKATGLK